ncbi:ABC transporter permease subunit [Secundilactobacillus kimchicus]|uniref:Phosphonate ABC transporter, permease protein PhnE n=1 Tax=Secundilactobacillus kimchicus JCM 15530 TaxID=1302272 RepID=A0A0R1HQ66_9LACO|nr:ABC transporter permease subunit [Secundilactobacillus kimchicus]KRK48636.1 phosphonate ABC transporter, permease protein PhnE [Secundilactobacillus kimchicus JCM 15530]MBT9672142.1 ABC transporter permease subunit [Secundilactobacillus kimchicus]
MDQQTTKQWAFFRRKHTRLFLVLLSALMLYMGTASLMNFQTRSLLGIGSGFAWMATNFVPNQASLSLLPAILYQLWRTFLIGISAATCAGVVAFLLALMGARNIGCRVTLVRVVIRGFASVLRNVPIVAWAMILLFSFKQNDLTGFLALFVMNLGFLIRAFIETIEDFDGDKVLALKATGATYGQIVVQAVLPEVSVPIVEWLLYMIENNIRDATLVGLLTGTGIGFLFDLYYKGLQYGAAGLVVLVIAILVIGIELSASKIGRVIA